MVKSIEIVCRANRIELIASAHNSHAEIISHGQYLASLAMHPNKYEECVCVTRKYPISEVLSVQ